MAGSRGLLVEYADLVSAQTAYVEALRRRSEGWLPELDDLVPAARTVLFDGVDDPTAVATEVGSWTLECSPLDGPLVDIPTVYHGSDLDDVACQLDLSAPEVVRLHTSAEHRVSFCGFAPGFAYISWLPAGLEVARRLVPRPSVPAGSVAVAGEFTGVYPRASPGGWQIIGRTNLALWDLAGEPPGLLLPGNRVRFISVEA